MKVMISYILNYLLCSALLFIPYKLWIENTSLLNFKRIYLLAIIILPFIIPSLNYTLSPKNNLERLPIPNIHIEDRAEQIIAPAQIEPTFIITTDETIHWSEILIIVYCIVSCVLFFRFLSNLYTIYRLKKSSQLIQSQFYTIVLSENVTTPFSFFNNVFVNKLEYQNGIPQTIWQHEEGHITQRHSFDILLLEITKIIAWFNPTLYHTKVSMQFNHECLADRHVLRDKNIIRDYCYLLLNLPPEPSRNQLVSELNYKQIKKRLIMMNQRTSNSKKIIWYGLSCLILISSTVIFSKKNIVLGEIITQLNQKQIEQDTSKLKIANGAPADLIAEYDSVINAITTLKKDKSGKTYTSRNMSGVNVDRMAFIASIMSKEQSEARTEKNELSPYKFWSVYITKPNKRTPTKQEFDNWQNTKVYGVWIDGKKAKNTELKKLKNTDIVLYYVSKLHGKAKVGRSYTHQLDVYTQPYYDEAFKNRK
ncbi:M56 family metallopeptidase [Sphingobacterium sp. SGL-16]|uniref:M56 family metallopeptidase n=1 Tax=Sphingobacterium sp. SGL-16 TaxID=2710883 RepID=UPI0013ED699C|nr:M56 family metallopeptidase [Sphingobacterium sp. SGL-16]NGM72904.1 hypothetical protein [Sphingobacterium sp. SGL-16]